jgi:hypothetical protein
LEESGPRLKPPSGSVHVAALCRRMASSFRMQVRHIMRNMARSEARGWRGGWGP